MAVLILLLVGFIRTFRPGLGEFWPENIDVSLCYVSYCSIGNVLNHTYDLCSWDPWFDMGLSDYGETSIKNCVQERDGDIWTPGCTTEGGLPYCSYSSTTLFLMPSFLHIGLT